jgi:hypothetical protein
MSDIPSEVRRDNYKLEMLLLEPTFAQCPKQYKFKFRIQNTTWPAGVPVRTALLD